MALLCLTADWAVRSGIRAFALSVDHGIRVEAVAEASRVSMLCGALGVPHATLRVTSSPPASNLQMWAREARYGLILDWCRKFAVGDLLTAHTLDDQAETFLLRLSRGSGVDGLAAISPATTRDRVRLLRPVLGVSRARLRATLESRGVEWIDDPTNDDPRFARVRARRALGALEPLGIDAQRIAEAARQLARARSALEAEARQFLRVSVIWGPLGEAILTPDDFRNAEPEIALRALAEVLGDVAGRFYRPRLRSLTRILAWIVSDAKRGGRTLHGCLVRRCGGGGTMVAREPAACAPPIQLRSGEVRVWDGRWRVALHAGPEVTVGAANPRDGIGLGGKEWDRASSIARAGAPAFRRDGRLVALPAAGLRVDGWDADAVFLRRSEHGRK